MNEEVRGERGKRIEGQEGFERQKSFEGGRKKGRKKEGVRKREGNIKKFYTTEGRQG
jgi:hypothetical protein